MSDDTAGFLYSWERIVLAARFSSTTKLVAFALRTFADPDGSKVRPSTARLCVLCDVSYASVKRARQDLIRAGLLEQVKRGNRRNGQAAEYRLILAEDIYDRLKWLSPKEIDAAAEKISEQRRAAETARLRNRNQGSDGDPETDQGSHKHPETPIRAHTRPGSGLTSEPPPTQDHHPTTETNSVVGNATHHARAHENAEPTSTAAEGEEAHRPMCGCGVLLDPDGSCFVCRTKPRRTR